MREAADPCLRLQILIFAGCFVVSFVYQTIIMTPVIGLYDEGIILFGARRVMEGDLIHRDFYSNYGPGQFYALAALFKLFSPSILVERLWHSFVTSLSVAVIFLIVARSTRSTLAALATAAACMIWFGSFGFYGYPVFPALAAVLTGLLCLVPTFNAVHSVWSLLAAGVCMGAAFLFRYDIGIATAAVMAVVLGLHAAVQPSSAGRRSRDIARCVMLFAVGFAFVAVPVIAAFIVHNAAGDLFFEVVTYPSEYYYKTRSLPFPNLWQVAGNPAAGVVYLPLVLVAAGCGTLALARRNRQTQNEHAAVAGRWAQIALIALTLLYFAKGAVRVSPIHMSMAIVTALVLTGIATANLAARHGVGRMASIAALALVTFLTMIILIPNARKAGCNLHAILVGVVQPTSGLPAQSFQTSCRALTGLRRLTCFTVDQDHLSAIEFLQAHTQPSEYVYVGLGRHDKVLINDVALYFLVNLRSTTKWYQFDPGLQTSMRIQREMIDELEHNHPHYIVLELQWDDVQEPNASAQSSGVVLLDDYIYQNFYSVATFGLISVLEHKKRP